MVEYKRVYGDRPSLFQAILPSISHLNKLPLEAFRKVRGLLEFHGTERFCPTGTGVYNTETSPEQLKRLLEKSLPVRGSILHTAITASANNRGEIAKSGHESRRAYPQGNRKIHHREHEPDCRGDQHG
jgi:hypothetical protein